jgi:hypothetical protein
VQAGSIEHIARADDQTRAWRDLVRAAHHSGDVVAGEERLVHDMTARGASGAEYNDPHHLNQQRYDRGPLERAIARGDLAKNTDVDLAIDRLMGPVYYGVLVTGQAVSPKFIESLVGEVVRSLLKPAS